jgi:hypothetical protein
LNYLFYQITRSIGVFFRTLKAFFSRKIMGLGSQLRRLTNFSRHATKAASSSLQGVVSAAQKPTGPSDYVETGRLYISKALIMRVILGLIALALIVYFVVWPFVLSRFLTARFYENDKRVADWSGRVIVFSDKKKTVPLYSGRLEDGVLQGECKQYDREGVLLYEGQLRDGERSGSGKEYQNGILAYEGQFDAGLYSGRGKFYADGELVYDGQYVEGKRSGSGTAYVDKKPLYEGQFMDDLYEGRGKLYQDGRVCYDGSFHAGEAEGTGTSYYPSGKIAYQGQFLSGKPDGAGTEYAEDGSKTYAGSFSEGAYNGDGTLYFSGDGQLTASFRDGEPTGNVEWKKNGFLYYQGEWSDGGPSGFGTLYNKAGKKLYEGPLLGGTIDGRALIKYTTEELRAALGEENLRSENDGAGFRIIAEELGLTALCTFQTEAGESTVYQLYLAAPEKNNWVSILPGMEHTSSAQWPEGVEPEQSMIFYYAQLGVSAASGSYPAETALSDGLRATVLYETAEREKAVLLTWERLNAVPTAQKPNTASGADSRVDALLGALDLMDGTTGAGMGAGASHGDKGAEGAFAEVSEAANAVSLADAMLSSWEQTERMSALEENLTRTGVLLEDAKNAAAKGLGPLETAEALEQEQLNLTSQIEACRTALKRAELQASAAGVDDLGSYALEDMLVSFDPSKQDVGELALVAAAYAQATGSTMTAEAAEAAVKTGLLDLADAHSAVELELTRYQAAVSYTNSAAGAYSMGSGSKESWYSAMNAQALARAGLCSALAEFSRQANAFNQLTGGWVSRTFGWHQDIFEPLFRAEILVVEEPEEEETGEDENTEKENDETESAADDDAA